MGDAIESATDDCCDCGLSGSSDWSIVVSCYDPVSFSDVHTSFFSIFAIFSDSSSLPEDASTSRTGESLPSLVVTECSADLVEDVLECRGDER